MKYHIISDIHGCYNTLTSLLKKININYQEDKLIFTGDYIDRGPNVLEVLEHIRNLKQNHGNSVILIQGNHEDMMINQRRWWDYNGNDTTINSLKTKNKITRWRKWLSQNTQPYYQDENIRVCHAGSYDEDLSANDLDTLLWDRCAFREQLYSGKLVIVGHTPIQVPTLSAKDQVIVYEQDLIDSATEFDIPETGLLDIDTGCVFGKRLTAVTLDFSSNKMWFTQVSNIE